MIRDRHTVLAALLSVPPVILVAALVDRLLPPPPALPAVVAANDRRIDALPVRPRTTHRDKTGLVNRPFAYRESAQ